MISIASEEEVNRSVINLTLMVYRNMQRKVCALFLFGPFVEERYFGDEKVFS